MLLTALDCCLSHGTLVAAAAVSQDLLVNPRSGVMLQLSASPTDVFAHQTIRFLGIVKMIRQFEALLEELYLLRLGVQIDPLLRFLQIEVMGEITIRRKAEAGYSNWWLSCSEGLDGANHGSVFGEAGCGIM